MNRPVNPDKPVTGFVAGDSQHANQATDITRIRDGQRNKDTDSISVEEPLEILVQGKDMPETTLAITMRTPGNDAELVAGFLAGEGIIRTRADVQLIEHCSPPSPDGLHNVIRVTLADDTPFDAKKLQRHFYTSSSCGVCGKTSIDQVMQSNQRTKTDQFRVSEPALQALPDKLLGHQSEFETTGGLHAAALFDTAGNILDVREDIGRHNALDKLIGHLLLEDQLPMTDHGIFLSGRAGFELVQKAVLAGAELVASIGPPSSLAVKLAEESGTTLAGFVRPVGMNIYCHTHRIENKQSNRS